MATYTYLTIACVFALVEMLTAAPLQVTPSRHRRSTSPCLDNVSFAMNTTGRGTYNYAGPAGHGFCLPTLAGIPTTITMNNAAPGCKYDVVRYAGSECQIHTKINSTASLHLNSTQSVLLNKRKPVCSFKLEDIPLPGDCVTVKFDGTHVEPVTICNTNSNKGLLDRCYNLHGSSCENIYPSHVTISKGDVVETNIRVTLYSGFSCAEGTRMVNGNTGNATINGTQNLYEWTHENYNEVVSSFELELL